MSADNTIIVLTLRDCYIVKHMQASDNLYFSWFPKNNESLVAIRIFENFVDEQIFGGRGEALMCADNLYREIGYVEYGIQQLNLSSLTWEDIEKLALEDVNKEIDILEKSTGFDDELKDLKELRNVLEGIISIQEWKDKQNQ